MTMELDTILCGDSLNMLKALPESKRKPPTELDSKIGIQFCQRPLM